MLTSSRGPIIIQLIDLLFFIKNKRTHNLSNFEMVPESAALNALVASMIKTVRSKNGHVAWFAEQHLLLQHTDIRVTTGHEHNETSDVASSLPLG